MKQSRLLGITCAGILVLGQAMTAEAAFIGRLPVTDGGTDWQAYYDTDLEISWMRDASVLGFGGWQPAVDWAAALVIGGATEWRLPSMDLDGDGVREDCSVVTAAVCLDNELGYHFWQSGIRPGNNQATIPANAVFSQVSVTAYWSSTTNVSETFAFALSFDSGNEGAGGIGTEGRVAWAVHDGDVGAIPVPAAVWLFGSGLLGLVGFSCRKKV